MKKKVIRKDGIEYERTVKEDQLTKKLTIRLSPQLIEKIKQVADYKNEKYNTMCRNIIEDYVEKEIEKWNKKN